MHIIMRQVCQLLLSLIVATGAPNEKIVQNHLNIALLNVLFLVVKR